MLAEASEHQDVLPVLLHRILIFNNVVSGVRDLLPQEAAIFTQDKMSSAFSWDFFHAFFGSGDAGRDDDCLTSPCSSRALFFDSFIFDGEDFILVVTSVSTRIHSGATGLAAAAVVEIRIYSQMAWMQMQM
jgi:hypothetical protein